MANSQKHLGLILDSKFDFNEHLDNKINKCNTFIGIMKTFIQVLLPSYLQTYHNAVSEGAHLTPSTTQNKIKPIPARTKVFENSFFP